MNTRESVRMQSPLDYWADWADGLRCWQHMFQLQSEPAISAASAKNRGLRRAQDLIAHARKHSPFYKKYLSGVPEGSPLEQYPPVTRTTLMENFDDWATDRRITRNSVDRFVSSDDRIGSRYLDDYLVWTSSGTSGQPGIFIQDKDALSIYQSLLTVRYQQTGRASAVSDPWHLAFDAYRMAMVAALEGHFAGVVFWKWASRINPWLASRTCTFSILQPLPTLVAQLNQWQPGFLSSYPSMLSVLAREQESGRLQLSPNSLWCGGEHLSEQQRQQIESAFGCAVVEDYGASEAMNMAFGCEHGRLHINTDWFILEPVDEHMQAVPAGQPSATTLVTNMANRVQPIIRYDIGDSITMCPDTCDCGRALPTMKVAGRNDDTLWLPSLDDQLIPVLPLALNTVIEETCGEFGFQLIQSSPQSLSIRTQGKDRQSRSMAYARIRDSLQEHFQTIGAQPVTMQHDPVLPERDQASGKLHQVSDRTEAFTDT